jgi:sortase A
MISFELYAHFFFKRKATSPIPEELSVSALEYAKSVYASSALFSSNLKDFSNANVWFPSGNKYIARESVDIKSYSLSIPKLNLLNLNVEVDGSDLSKSLIHYLPASIPGQYGNISIFGHSSLPQLFNMSDYKTVFTYLPKMTIGDKIYIETKGVTYEYEVFDMFIVKPSEISVLDQKFDNSYLTLVTCVPPGTYKDRLIVRAKIIDK